MCFLTAALATSSLTACHFKTAGTPAPRTSSSAMADSLNLPKETPKNTPSATPSAEPEASASPASSPSQSGSSATSPSAADTSAADATLTSSNLPSAADPSRRVGDYSIPTSNVAWVAPNGSDSNDGTEARPYATFAKAVASVDDGGTVVAKEGTYREPHFFVTKSNITIQSAPGAEVWLKGSDVVDASRWKQQGSVWTTTGDFQNFCTVCTINKDPEVEGMAAHPEQVFINGTALQQVDSKDKVTSGTFYVEDRTPTTLKTPGDNTKGLNVGKQDAITYYVGSDPTAGTTEISQRARAMSVTGKGFTLTGINVGQFAPLQSWQFRDEAFGVEPGAVAVFIAAQDATVVDSTFTGTSSGSALSFEKAHGTKVINNRFVHNGGGGAGANRTNDIVFEGNYFALNNQAGFEVDECGAYCTIGDIKVTHSERTVFRGNVVDYSESSTTASAKENRRRTFPAFWCDEGCIDAVAVNNFFTNTGYGVFFEVSSGGVIASNIVEGATAGIVIGGSDNVKIYNNTVSRTFRPIFVYEDTRYDGCNARDASNKCIAPEQWSISKGLRWDATGIEVYNNIVSSRAWDSPTDDKTSPASLPVYIRGGVNADGRAIHSNQMFAGFDYNAYYRSDTTNEPTIMNWDLPNIEGAIDIRFPSTESVNTDGNTKVSGIETHALDLIGSREDNPLFNKEASANSDYKQSDYRLKDGSPAIGSGTPLPDDVAKAIDPEGTSVTAGTTVNRGALLNSGMTPIR